MNVTARAMGSCTVVFSRLRVFLTSMLRGSPAYEVLLLTDEDIPGDMRGARMRLSQATPARDKHVTDRHASR